MLSESYIVTIPKRALPLIGWQEGQLLLVSVAPGRVVLELADAVGETVLNGQVSGNGDEKQKHNR